MSIRISSILQKIEEKTEIDEFGCWVWQGGNSGKTGRGKGYPRMYLDGYTVAVHRVVWTCNHGYLPNKLQIDHTCKNRLCVNPKHLEMVTHKENQKRRRKNG